MASEEEKYRKVTDKLGEIMEETNKVIVGQEEVREQLLIAILCDGNILVESVPGLGKTKMVRTLSEVMGLDFSRIQNTPDLMPSDITGTHIIDESSETKQFVFQEGPIFANMVLADEINRATPKCVAGDTPIVTSDGEVREAEELFTEEAGKLVWRDHGEEWWKPSDDLAVPSFNPETGEMENKPVSYIYRQRTEKPTYQITLASGRTIEVSNVHPFFTIEDGHITTKKAEDITERDCVLLPATIDVSSTSEIEYDREILKESEAVKEEIHRRKNLHEEFRGGTAAASSETDRQLLRTFQKRTPSYIEKEVTGQTFVTPAKQFGQVFPITAPVTVSEELAHLTALIVAEGYTSRERGIQIGMKNHEIIQYAANCIRDIFDYDINIYDSDSGKKRIVAGSSTFSTLLEAMDVEIEGNSAEKRVPDFIMTASKVYVKAFLEMFFEAEGTVNREHIRMTSKSEDMVNQIAYLLLRFGIIARSKEETQVVSGAEETYHNLYLYGRNVERFAEEIGFYGERKQEELEQLVEGRQGGKFMDLIPEMHDTIREVRKENGITHRKFRELTGQHAHNIENPNNRRRHSRERLEAVYDGLREDGYDAERLENIVNGEFVPDYVASVEKEEGEKVLYDLTVEDTHSFVAGKGGIIIHNTQSSLLEAMQEQQVTAGNETYELDDPFFLMATQNPLEMEGTFPIPVAQLDRFMMKIFVDFPEPEEESVIVDRFTTSLDYSPDLEKVLSRGSIIKLQEVTRQVPIAEDIRDRVVRIVNATRDLDNLSYGASPRGSLNLVLAAKAHALVEGRTHVSNDDVDAMAKPVLRHRIGLSFQAEREGLEPDDVIDRIVEEV